MDTILEKLGLKLGDEVTNGRGNSFTVVASTEDRRVESVKRSLGPSVQVSITTDGKELTIWVDKRLWDSGEWFKVQTVEEWFKTTGDNVF